MDWIRNQMVMNGTTQRELADVLGLSEQKMSHVFTGRRKFKAVEVDQIRRYFGYTMPEDAPPTIAVSGRVGAGDYVDLVDDYEKGAGMFVIRRPQWLPKGGIGAAVVEGSSAEPWALPGDVIFWHRSAITVDPNDLGRPVIAELADGRVMLKRLANGSKPGLWSLMSINPTHPNVFDQQVRWASRVLAPLSQDQMEIVEP